MVHLANEKKCTGCSACVNSCPRNCIAMQLDEQGFYFPVMKDTAQCVECGKCEQSCPILNKNLPKQQETLTLAAFSKNSVIKEESSSGGVFSELALKILETGGVIFGASYDNEFGVKHIEIREKEDLWKLRGAKYAQSNIGDCFLSIESYLKQGQKVLFSGTPCQIAGLNSYLHKEYMNLICVDFVCHGVPSVHAWMSYVKYRAEKDNNSYFPREINLRSKNTGWSNYNYSVLFEYDEDKRYLCKSSKDIFMKLFVGDYINRESCSNCQYKGYDRLSDITLGDFWGIWDIAPEMDNNEGTSLILVHSEKARLLMKEISEKIVLKELSLEQASEQNPSLLVSSVAKAERTEILQMSKIGLFDEISEKLFSKTEKAILKQFFNKIKCKLFSKINSI